MRPLAWMAGVSVVSWAVITAAASGQTQPELTMGMLGPLASAVATWLAIVRAHAAGPAHVTGALIQTFVLQVVFFGAYVAVMLRVLDARPVPFVVSFTGYFLALHVMEALFLKRLLRNDLRPPSRERIGT